VTPESIARALQRVRAVLTRRPEAGLHADEPAISCWQGGMCVVTRHANGTQLTTDLPQELGGSGGQVTPGWLVRAGLASCTATCIAKNAAEEGIVLTRIEVTAASTSDARGLFGMTNAAGEQVRAGPQEMQLRVRIAGSEFSTERLQALVDKACRCSPVADSLAALPINVHVELAPA
jgi:uncharacterized OsmC-like protein